MVDDLLDRAHNQAQKSSPPVRAAARLRIARVESVSNPAQARATLQSALDEIPALTGRERHHLLDLAQQIAAAVAPDLIRTIPATRHFPYDHQSGMLVKIMLDHDRVDEAYNHVVNYDDPGSFPFLFLGNLMQELDDDRSQAVLRSAIKAWQAQPTEEQVRRQGSMPAGPRHSHFHNLFEWHWKLLSAEEALAIVHEIVRAALKKPDQGASARYPDAIHFTSPRDHALFEVLHILRHLDPPLAESLIAAHPQLAAAALRYPNGTETMHQESERRAEERRKQMAASGEACTGGFIMAGAGDQRNFARQMALHKAVQEGNFEPSIEDALERYAEDAAPASPNYALKTFWSSACAFRAILFTAGQRLGIEAASLLDRIPDDDLRLFALIELAAALVDLPVWSETSMRQPNPPGAVPDRRARLIPSLPRNGPPMKTPDDQGVRCPKCQWLPPEGTRWVCKCGHIWNTFWTRGRCPACQHQWQVTHCHNCHQPSAHKDWYLPT